ncbi:hypothetical protein G5714_008657 [Onychostoma macrolepis]|uniref:Uncharacterized protein n=1 Tax=Onychostoma macrolepis TaxID=369639 RepID=A0A7J6CWB3_9TELE|nr:hypothetical protein G5714_008657 [Onychostoma macrolepis]
MVVMKPKPGATSASGIRSALYKAYSLELPVPSTLDPKAAYADFKPDSLPLICKINLSPDKPLVDSVFGKRPPCCAENAFAATAACRYAQHMTGKS